MSVLILAAFACTPEPRIEPSGPSEPEAPTAVRAERTEERDALVAVLRAKGIRDDRVLDAIAAVPRHAFVPDFLAPSAYDDRPLPIGLRQTISQPYIVAYMSQALDVREGDKVLEIGTGSGYQAAVLAELSADVYSIEIIPELSHRAAEALATSGYRNIHLRVGDGYAGWPEHAPFDRVLLTAAPGRIPEPLVEQLARGGRLVAPLTDPETRQQWIWEISKDDAGRVHKERTLRVRFVPMTGEVEKLEPN